MGNIEANVFPTRMHSSGMRTARLLTVSSGKGVSTQGDVCQGWGARGLSARGVSAQGDVCSGDVCLGLSLWTDRHL